MSFKDTASKALSDATMFVAMHPKTSMVLALIVILALAWLAITH